MIDSLLYAILPTHFKQSINLAHLENGTDDQIVANLEQKLELSGLGTDRKLPNLTKANTTATVSK